MVTMKIQFADTIEANVEQAYNRVEQGTDQLAQASRYQVSVCTRIQFQHTELYVSCQIINLALL